MTIKHFIKYNHLDELCNDENLEKAIRDLIDYHIGRALIIASGEAPLHCTQSILNCYSKDKIE